MTFSSEPLSNLTFTPGQSLLPAQQQPGQKAILFSFNQQLQADNLPIYFGVYIHTVQHIHGQTTVYSSGKTPVGIAQLQDQEVTVLDLSRYLWNAPLPQSNYLIVLKTSNSELLGIPVTDSPILVDIAQDKIRLLPPTYRQIDQLGIASEVAAVDIEGLVQTAFLLDLDCLVQLVLESTQSSKEDSLAEATPRQREFGEQPV